MANEHRDVRDDAFYEELRRAVEAHEYTVGPAEYGPGATAKPTPPRYELVQIPIPETTPEHYITGLYALNIPAPEGTTGDWHQVFRHRAGRPPTQEVTLGGGEYSTNHLFGSWGVTEGRERLESVGLAVPDEMRNVYVANHMRAIADLVYESVRKYGTVRRLQGATRDWLDTNEQRDTVFAMARRIAADSASDAEVVEAIEQWIADETGTDERTSE